MKCPKCGKEISDQARFCPDCGCLIKNDSVKKEDSTPQRLSDFINEQNALYGNRNTTPARQKSTEKPSTLSILALIFSILGCLVITSIVGLILSIIDLTKKDGRSKVLSIIALVLSCIWIVFVLMFAGTNTSETSSNEKASAESTVETDTTEKIAEDLKPTETIKPTEDLGSTEVSTPNPSPETVETEAKDSIPKEYKSALNKANTYSDTMYMSKAAIYDQLTSEYGEQFSEEAAQYAIDNMDADWNYNALKKAEDYSETMYMSKLGIYDQLISEYGERFTEAEAQYAIDNVQADWNANALEKAKSYQDMDMAPAAIYDQLISEYGEKFTESEAQYAIDNLE